MVIKATDSIKIHNVIARNYARLLQDDPQMHRQAHSVAKLLPIKNEDVILDVGAGTGRIAHSVLEDYEVNAYYALEPSKLIDYFAVKDSKVNVLKGQGQNIPLKDGRCDVVFAEQVLIHIRNREDQLNMLREMRRVTRDGGFVCLTTTLCYNVPTPLLRFLRKRERYFKCKSKSEDGKDVYAYRRFFTIEEMRQLMHISGLKIVKVLPKMRLLKVLSAYSTIIAQK